MYRIEVVIFRLRVMVHGCHVSRLLVPVTVIIVGHDGDPVQVSSNGWNIVSIIDDLLAGRDRGRQQKTLRLKGRAQLVDPGCEAFLITLVFIFAVNLWNI